MPEGRVDTMLAREAIANRPKHWVRAVTACNSRCLFCLDADTPRNVYLPEDEVQAELRRGIEELGADKVIISGGEATLHPSFVDFIRYGRSIGYDRVQTVTNGTRFADRAFYRDCMAAGLGEITFSLHGHTAELHDHLTQTPNGFHKLMKGMIRALRDPNGPIVNVDVVINKQNVAYIDRIIELAASVGVTEFDLLHVIPQANAFDNRDTLFYDVREHLPKLQKVFRLNQHRRFVIWTNRFPVSYLEGLEDLIQDPHKMLDEVNGRRFMVRNYLDTGAPLSCRDVERCKHCFIEPFCTTMDRTMATHSADQVEVWEGDADSATTEPPPLGARWIAVDGPDMTGLSQVTLPDGVGLEASVTRPGPLPPNLPRPLRLVAKTAEALGHWAPELPEDVSLVVHLNQSTAPYLLAHRDTLPIDRMRIHQPTWEHLSTALQHDLADPQAFFAEFQRSVPVSGLAPCQAPGTQLVDVPTRAAQSLFDPSTGRIDIQALAKVHVRDHYRAHSVRCADCRVRDRCEGVHINMVRASGLKLARPLIDGEWAEEADRQLRARWPIAPTRVLHGAPTVAPPPGLPGSAQVTDPVRDPLGEAADRIRARRKARLAERRGDA